MEKKTKKGIISIFIIFIVTIVALPFILWQIHPSKNLDVIIIDKTVPDVTYREHKGFMWILNNLKIKNGNSTFQYSKDYYGFIPMENQKYKMNELPNWIKINYAMQYGVKWGFEGPGIVFVGLGDKIVVLREGAELGKGLNTIKFTPKAVKEFTVKNNYI